MYILDKYLSSTFVDNRIRLINYNQQNEEHLVQSRVFFIWKNKKYFFKNNYEKSFKNIFLKNKKLSTLKLKKVLQLVC